MKKTVYVAMSADFIHSGHLNVINKARELGDVIIGVLTDEAVVTYKRLPLLNFEHRKVIMENLKGISQVVAQTSSDYTENLLKYKPDYVVHGDDWKLGPLSLQRHKVIETLKQWNGQLVEVPYTTGLSNGQLVSEIRKLGTTPEIRRASLRRLLEVKPVVRIMEVHNGLTGLIVENTSIDINDETREFDGMWESSLTDSTSKGKPDTSAVDVTSRTHTIDQILEVTTKPMIVDADNGGQTEHFMYTVRTLERLGVSAVIIEDKTGFKRNSLFGADANQQQDSIEEFSYKISQGKKAQLTKDFMIIARIESLILKMGMDDALKRARAYITAGADGIMIHSSQKSPEEVLNFSRTLHEEYPNVPIVVVPSTYGIVTERELSVVGVRIVIYANQLLRAAFPAMVKTAKTILTHTRCLEADEYCMPIKEIITLIPEGI